MSSTHPCVARARYLAARARLLVRRLKRAPSRKADEIIRELIALSVDARLGMSIVDRLLRRAARSRARAV